MVLELAAGSCPASGRMVWTFSDVPWASGLVVWNRNNLKGKVTCVGWGVRYEG